VSGKNRGKELRIQPVKSCCVEKWSIEIFACRNSKVGLRSK
jgi:hypothetical protein